MIQVGTGSVLVFHTLIRCINPIRPWHCMLEIGLGLGLGLGLWLGLGLGLGLVIACNAMGV